MFPKSVSDSNPENWVSGGPLPVLAECLREMGSGFLLVRSEGEPELAMASALHRPPIVVERKLLTKEIVTAIDMVSSGGMAWSYVCLIGHAAILHSMATNGNDSPMQMCVLELADGSQLGETSLMHMASYANSLERLTGYAELRTMLTNAGMALREHLKGLPVRNLRRRHLKVSIRQSGPLSYPQAAVGNVLRLCLETCKLPCNVLNGGPVAQLVRSLFGSQGAVMPARYILEPHSSGRVIRTDYREAGKILAKMMPAENVSGKMSVDMSLIVAAYDNLQRFRAAPALVLCSEALHPGLLRASVLADLSFRDVKCDLTACMMIAGVVRHRLQESVGSGSRDCDLDVVRAVLFTMVTLHESVDEMAEKLSSSTDRAEMSRFLFPRLASDASQVLPEAHSYYVFFAAKEEAFKKGEAKKVCNLPGTKRRAIAKRGKGGKSKKTRGVGDGKRGRQWGKNDDIMAYAIESSDEVSQSDLVSESDVEGKAMSVDGEGTNTVEEGDYVGPGDVEKSPGSGLCHLEEAIRRTPNITLNLQGKINSLTYFRSSLGQCLFIS